MIDDEIAIIAKPANVLRKSIFPIKKMCLDWFVNRLTTIAQIPKRVDTPSRKTIESMQNRGESDSSRSKLSRVETSMKNMSCFSLFLRNFRRWNFPGQQKRFQTLLKYTHKKRCYASPLDIRRAFDFSVLVLILETANIPIHLNN